MVNQDKLFSAMGGIKDEYVLSAADLLGYTKEDDELNSDKTIRLRKTTRMLLIAAVVTALLAATAFAAIFALSHRVPDKDETFRIQWSDGYLEWTDAKLAVTFPETAESSKIEFRPGWLPFDLPEELGLSDPWTGLTKDTWFRLFSSESLCWRAGSKCLPEFKDMEQPVEITAYAMSQFNNGGAMLLLYQTPGEITEEHWDQQDADVLRFTTTQQHKEELKLGTKTYTVGFNYIVMANARAGWVVVVDGELDMDTLVKIAKNLEIRETGETATYDDFTNHYVMFDGGVG